MLNVRAALQSALLLTLSVSCGLTALAAETLSLSKRHLLNNAATVHITPRGQKYFSQNLQSVTDALGFDLRSGYFAEFEYESDKSYHIKDLAESPADQAMLMELKNFMESWLVGFSLNQIRPKVKIGESGYVASFKRFSLLTDQALMNKLQYKDGAVLVVEFEIDKLNVGLDSLSVEDLGNPQFGRIGAQGLKLDLAPQSESIRLRVPFYVNINAAGILEFKTLDVTTNIDKAQLSLSLQKFESLQIKAFVQDAQGKTYEVNNKLLQQLAEAKLRENIPVFLPKVTSYLANFVKVDLPKWLNQKAYEFLLGKLEQIDYMDVPNAPQGAQPFTFGLRLEQISLQSNTLKIQLAGFVEDSLNPDLKPLASDAARAAPSLNLIEPEKYDVAMTVNRSIVNRILQLSTERGVFKQIDISGKNSNKKEYLKIVGTPKVDAIPKSRSVVAKNSRETYIKLRVRIERTTSFFGDVKEWAALTSPYQVEVDVWTKLRPAQDGKLEVILWRIDETSLGDMTPYLKMVGLKTVTEGVKDTLRGMNKDWETDRAKGNELKLPGTLPLPPEIAGIKTQIHSMDMDANGHLILYLTYGGRP